MPAPLVCPPLRGAPHRDLCTDCGVSRMEDPKACSHTCQFIRPGYPRLERRVHGRERAPEQGGERFFGPAREILRVRLASSGTNQGELAPAVRAKGHTGGWRVRA